MKVLKNILFLMVVIISTPSYSVEIGVCSENINALSVVGLDSKKGNAYVSLEGDDYSECECEEAIFDSSFSKSESALKLLMTAKTEGKRVRIDFETEDGVAVCNKAYKAFIY